MANPVAGGSSPERIELSTHAQRAFRELAADMERVFGSRLHAVVAYAMNRAAVFTETLDAADLDALSSLAETWHKSGLETPLLLTSDEFRRSIDAFPLEYQAIIDHHTVIAGTPPFAAVSVGANELRRACEAQAKGHLIHLREVWIDSGAHGHGLERAIANSAMPLRVLLLHVASLDGSAHAHLFDFVGARFPDDADILRAVLVLESRPEGAHALLSRLPQYLTACEHIWAFTDAWHA